VNFENRFFSLKSFIGRQFEVGVTKTLPGTGTAKKRIVDKQKTKEIEPDTKTLQKLALLAITSLHYLFFLHTDENLFKYGFFCLNFH